MRTFLTVIFTFFMIHLSSYADTVRIGNAGEGFLTKDGKVYLLDLYERGSHRIPYVGDRVDSRISFFNNRIQFRQAFTGFRTRLLLRKLSDFEEHRIGLGRVILHILSRLEIRFTSEELPLVDNDTTTVDPKNRVQLAYRKHLRLEISRKYWEKMDSYNRVALLIHEALFTLIKPVCENEFCHQPSVFVRQLVGDLFLKYPPNDLTQRMNDFLTLPEKDCGEEFMNITISAFRGVNKFFHRREFSYTAITLNNKLIDKNIYDFCHAVKDSPEFSLDFYFKKYVLPIRQTFFPTPYGTQSVFNVGDLKEVESNVIAYTVDGITCYHKIKTRLQKFNLKGKKIGVNAFPSCSSR